MTQLIGSLIVSRCICVRILSNRIHDSQRELWVSRVDEETEAKGLDVTEHGAPAYAQSSTITAAPEPAVATVEA